MHIGVIRGDLPGPVLLSGLEPVSQHNPSTEPSGQEVYVSRPTVAELEAVFADADVGLGAAIEGGTITFNLVIDGTNDTLRLKTSAAAAFTDVLIAQTTYTTLADLVTAIQAALDLAGVAVTVYENRAGDGIVLESNTLGVTSYLESDTDANGSTANGDLAIADGEVRTLVALASDLITDGLPVGGPLDVSAATLEASGTTTAAAALAPIPVARGTTAAVANAIAPKIADTPVAVDSFLAGQISDLLNANFNPDPRRNPALVNGAAVEVVEDDGSTDFATANALPAITSATLDSPGAGDVTIAGTNLAGPGAPTAERKEVTVKFTGTGTPGGPLDGLVLSQELIEANGGTVTATSIVVPAVLNDQGGFATGTTAVSVKYRSFAAGPEDLA